MLNRVTINGNIIDIGTSDNDGSFIVNVPDKVRFRIGTDGKITFNELTIEDTNGGHGITSTKPICIDSPETNIMDNGVDRLFSLEVELANIFREISVVLDTIIADTGSTATTGTLNGLIDEIGYNDGRHI